LRKLPLCVYVSLNGGIETGLAAGGRGACEELGGPVADQGAGLRNRCGSADPDQNNGGGGNGGRGGGVHGNAQRALVGRSFSLMEVRYLDEREDGQKNKAENGHHRQST